MDKEEIRKHFNAIQITRTVLDASIKDLEVVRNSFDEIINIYNEIFSDGFIRGGLTDDISELTFKINVGIAMFSNKFSTLDGYLNEINGKGGSV